MQQNTPSKKQKNTKNTCNTNDSKAYFCSPETTTNQFFKNGNEDHSLSHYENLAILNGTNSNKIKDNTTCFDNLNYFI